MRRTPNWKLLTTCWFLMIAGHVTSPASGDKDKEEEPASPYSFEKTFTESTESTPEGFAAASGTWRVDGKEKALLIVPQPIVEGRIEFWPELRESTGTIYARTRAITTRPIRPRMGVALFGENGFQFRIAAGHDRIELARRGEVIVDQPFRWKEGESYHLELTVEKTGENDSGTLWMVSGRVWDKGGKRPDSPILTHRTTSDELEFPLAGKPGLVATPYSGDPIYFEEVWLFKGTYDELQEKLSKEKKKDDTGS